MGYRLIPNPDLRTIALSKVRKTVLLNEPEDLAWVRDVHLLLPESVGAVVVFGNEDSPEGFLVYKAKDPLLSDVPDVFVRDEEDA